MNKVPSSFRDNSGYVFEEQGIFYRHIFEHFTTHFEHLVQSGLYDDLTKNNLFISHEIIEQTTKHIIIKPYQLTTISYAYEWSFDMLKDAAICTLKNAIKALAFGMILKDANTHNIQFVQGKPMLIDSLSFEKYNEGKPWIAYRQFCECFLAPLVLMKYTHANINKLLIAYPNGIPLGVAHALLPIKAKLNLNVFLHLVLPNQVKQTVSENAKKASPFFSKKKLETLLHGLLTYLQKLELPNHKTTWDNYYTETILSASYLETKKKLVTDFLGKIEYERLLDLGANDGAFTLLPVNQNKKIIAIDEDSNCINNLYSFCKKNNITHVHPIINDLTTPSPSLGWHHAERPNSTSRICSDVTMALALVHHLAIAKNIPIEYILNYCYELSPYLLIEFVAKEDEKVQQLLAHRDDIFDHYTLEHFTTELQNKYTILDQAQVGKEHRWLFLAQRKI